MQLCPAVDGRPCSMTLEASAGCDEVDVTCVVTGFQFQTFVEPKQVRESNVVVRVGIGHWPMAR